MSEAAVEIRVGDMVLEARYARGLREVSEAAILCHPHPLYGGSMDNNVVVAMQEAYSRFGWSTLRFNFRGVGRSGGSYGNGVGEAEDIQAVAEYLLRERHSSIHLAGYSFGAWVVLRALQWGLNSSHSVALVSPPLDFLDFADLKAPKKPCLITLGDRDDFCGVESLERWISAQSVEPGNVDRIILQRCDHFYWGHESALSMTILEFLRKHFPSRGI